MTKNTMLDLLHRRLVYDGTSGLFTWKPTGVSSFDARWAGGAAGMRGLNGRVSIRFFDSGNEHRIQAATAAWIMCHGSVKDGAVIDHKNGDCSDNRLENLRVSERWQNQANRTYKRNKSGSPGVSSFRGSWRARLSCRGEAIELGYFKRKADAIAARRAAEIKYYGEFSPFLSRTNVQQGICHGK